MPISLLTAFDSTFHQEFKFDDFINLKIALEYNTIPINDKLIISPSEKLKKYHRFLNSFVFEYAKINTNILFSYRQGVNIYNAIEKHAQSKYFFQTDISNFFGSITKKEMEVVFSENLQESPITDLSDYQNNILNLIMVNNSLPIGFSTSPCISNTCLFAFDNAIEKYCLNNKIFYTRYSDDLIFSTTFKSSISNIQEEITKQLKLFFHGGLSLNHSKTKYFQKGQKIKLLGLVILPNGKISVDIKTKNQLEILMHFYMNNREKFQNYCLDQYKGGFDNIAGSLKFINMIDKDFLSKLRKKYGNFIVDAFYNNSIEK